jgi:hypothetical protein
MATEYILNYSALRLVLARIAGSASCARSAVLNEKALFRSSFSRSLSSANQSISSAAAPRLLTCSALTRSGSTLPVYARSPTTAKPSRASCPPSPRLRWRCRRGRPPRKGPATHTPASGPAHGPVISLPPLQDAEKAGLGLVGAVGGLLALLAHPGQQFTPAP